MNKSCALVIGHSEESPGACNSTHGDSEYSFNNYLAHKIIARVKEGFVIKVYRDCSYGKIEVLKP